MYIPFSIIVLLPLLFYLVDGYYEKNIKKGVFTIVAFVVLMVLTVILTKLFGLYFIMITPAVLLLIVVISRFFSKK